MLDFGPFCYLDTQKTGSTFIRRFLEKHSRLPHAAIPAALSRRHASLRAHHPGYEEFSWLRHRLHPRRKLFFVSVRHPLDTYLSIYNYGVDGRGGARRNFAGWFSPTAAELAEIYDGTAAGFCRWLEMMLRPTYPYAVRHWRERCGILTWRFLRLCVFDVLDRESPPEPRSRVGIRALYRLRKLHGPIIRAETLEQDLARLIRGRLRPWIKDVDAALAELESGPRRENQSNRRDRHWQLDMPAHLRRKLAEREWFFAAELGYSFKWPRTAA